MIEWGSTQPIYLHVDSINEYTVAHYAFKSHSRIPTLADFAGENPMKTS